MKIPWKVRLPMLLIKINKHDESAAVELYHMAHMADVLDKIIEYLENPNADRLVLNSMIESEIFNE